MEELTEFIESNPKSKELKRAIAVQMVQQNMTYETIAKMVTAQPIGSNDLRGFKAIRIDSKAEKPCLFPVLTMERTAANILDLLGNKSKAQR